MKNPNRCFQIQRSLNVTDRERQKLIVIQFGIALFLKEQMIRGFKLQPFIFKFDRKLQIKWKKQYDGYAQFWSNGKKGNCQQLIISIPNAKLVLIIPVVFNTIRLLIPIVFNITDVVMIIKYQIVVNNTSDNYTKMKFRSSFLGYSPNGICVITFLDKFIQTYLLKQGMTWNRLKQPETSWNYLKLPPTAPIPKTWHHLKPATS